MCEERPKARPTGGVPGILWGMMHNRSIATPACALAGVLLASPAALAGDAVLPPGFQMIQVTGNLQRPIDIAFAADGRLFITEMAGRVRIVEDGVLRPEPFIDLLDEVNGRGERGLLGIALDPDFLSNRRVYLLYTVDPIYGQPDESPSEGAFGRLTCYTGTEESNGNIADPDSRCVLIGATWSEGFPVCDLGHTIGTVLFGRDGSLFAGAGDGSRPGPPDSGGLDPDCFGEGRFGKDEDIGAFRSQYLDSLAGKIVRVDPATGLGLPTNPYWTGDGADNRSRVWVSGLRVPYRFSLRPEPGGPGAGPGTLYIGDVGRAMYEEVNVAFGGENFGWPCREGFHASPDYQKQTPPHSGCDTIETKSNPGPLTDPIMDMHHSDPALSDPPDVASRCVIGGLFYEGTCYPEPYQGGYFYMDQRYDWIRYAEIDAQHNVIATHPFVENLLGPVDVASDPLTGDLFIAAFDDERDRVVRIRYLAPGCGATCVGDIDGDGMAGFADLLLILSNWGSCGLCPEDLDGNGDVGFGDVLLLLSNWGTCA